jgi:DNA-binding transcriptional ArsR family regulator
MSSTDRCDLLCLDLVVAERLRKNRLSPAQAEATAGKARALADPTRLTLAAALLDANELCVCDLAWIAERSQTLVSHHVRVLRTHGIVRSRRDGKMVIYSLTDEGRTLLASVLAVPGQAAKRKQGVHA